MSLSLYKKKRKFQATPEPEGGDAKGDALIFCVQKHAASHLHYDFRLEMEGVLKSWAVPKGPSLNPDDKRLAMMVEDHPYDYKDFEGNIPKGNYGAGNVIVWDRGTYHAADGAGKDESALLAGLRKGHISFILDGKKLKGEYALVKIKGSKQDNAWLLIKKDDQYASDKDITKSDKSVISHVTLESLAKKYNTDAEDDKIKKPVKKAAAKKTVPAPAPESIITKRQSKKKPVS